MDPAPSRRFGANTQPDPITYPAAPRGHRIA